ncbi:helicase-like protein [Rhodopseudomonas palustris BisB5]|uniref:Helicase-like protein n=1 Tax=Rhodopseudomonas palustris (strain BisB5) TaxID=316057 RepID=Q13F87_RHOPS|nr:helicase-like protein [Rhodopseudomonas palustris BisB5]
MDVKPLGRSTGLVGGGNLQRFSSRLGRLSHVYLKDQLRGASEYRRIAGYFRSSIFDLVNEEIEGIGKVRIVCNSDLDPEDINAAKQARTQLLKEKWNEVDDAVESFFRRPRYQRLFDILTKGNVEIRVVSRADAPFVHGKAGVIYRPDGTSSAFMGSLNETREGWSANYEFVWEDTSADGVAWVEDEFEYLWERGKPLPDAIIEEIGRSARRVEVQLADLTPAEVAPAALVEADIYRKGEELMPWQRAFVSLFLEHRETYGQVRLLLADEVGVGKTLSLAGSALVSALLGDGPVLILCPATLTAQWQIELKDRLNIPSAVWLSQEKAWLLDPDEIPMPSVGPEGVVKCPRQIALVSTGLIFHKTEERELLMSRRYGMVILDEAHRARGKTESDEEERKANNLLSFMTEIAKKTTHVLLGTATPIQTDVEDMWDLLKILGMGAEHVIGDAWSEWRSTEKVVPVITGKRKVTDDRDAWSLFRNPLPASAENEVIFGLMRGAIEMPPTRYVTQKGFSDINDDFCREQFIDDVLTPKGDLGFFQRNNPVVRHVVLRKRSTLEQMNLLPRIPVDIHPLPGQHMPALFDGLGLRTSSAFDAAYEAADKFTKVLRKRKKSAGFMRSLMLQRLCSSYASGLSTAEKLLAGRSLDDEELMLDLGPNGVELIDEERLHLQTIIDVLSPHPTDPKLDAVLYFLEDKGWLEKGCIIFSQYFDTTRWIGETLTGRLPREPVAVYAGAGKSGIYIGGEWKSVEREQIKKAVKERTIRLVVATDAACEGLNLQTLGTLINVDLPWNPSRLEQRIGRIKRFGQRRERVDMLNLVYHGSQQLTVDEKVYQKLSSRMKDRFDIFGTLPDVIDDDWIDDEEEFDARLNDFTEKRKRANAFDLRYASDVDPKGERWELCEKVLARADVTKRLSRGWGERERADG